VGTILVKQALQRVSTLLQDINPQWVRWPESELVNWLNDAQAAIAKYLPSSCSRMDAFKLAGGTRQYIGSIPQANLIPGDGVALTAPVLGNALLDVLCNMGSAGTTEGIAIRPVERDVLDSQNPNWRSSSVANGTVRQYTYDPETPRFFHVSPPVPVGANVWVLMSYLAQPVLIPNTGTPGSELYSYGGNNTTPISVADEYIDDLVNYVVARANMKAVQWSDNNKAVAFTNMFTSSINAKAAALTGVNPNLKTLPFAPEPLGRAS
jgi:hypothetical protein